MRARYLENSKIPANLVEVDLAGGARGQDHGGAGHVALPRAASPVLSTTACISCSLMNILVIFLKLDCLKRQLVTLELNSRQSDQC